MRRIDELHLQHPFFAAVKHIQLKLKSGAQVFLLTLRPDENLLYISPFTDEEAAMASHEYMEEEKRIRESQSAQAVLVSVQSVKGLQTAFPNYFADTGVFVNAVKRALS